MQSPLKIASRLLLSLVLTAAAACSGDDGGSTGPSTPPPSGEVSGTYSLTQVRTNGNLGGGGSSLPVTFTDGAGNELKFVSGTLVMGADGSFDLDVQATYNGGAVTMTDYGTYSAAGNSIDFNSQKSTPRLSTGTLSGSKLTANAQFGGIPFEIDVVR
ncbi:MAG TPA: hypothetical protein VFO06_10700 [Gemmatimonadales bacterium]|nr:hypothetical protein [Gemmatimonadales bacterium]